MNPKIFSTAVLSFAASAVIADVTTNAVTAAPSVIAVERIESRSYDLVFASAAEVAEVVNRTWMGSAASWGVSRVAVPMPDVNTLVVTAPESVQRSCESLLKRLDRRQRQVYVEARFVELSNDASRQLGIHWGVFNEVGVQSAQATLSYSRRTGDNNSYKVTTKSGNDTTEISGTDYSENTVFSGLLSTSAMSLLMSALEASSDVKTFQNPKVIVTSGREARVDMTTKRPNVIVSAKRVVNGSNNTLDADMRMAEIPGHDKLMFAGESFFSWGVELTVMPRVQTNGLINVRIVPTISDVDNYVTVKGGDDDDVPYSEFPVIGMRRIVSEFSMKSGSTAVIGGLSYTKETEIDTGIPWLQDIPLIGNKLFGYRSRVKEQKEIMVFVTVGLVDPDRLDLDVGLPKNAVLSRQYTDGVLKEPGDRKDAIKGVRSLDLRDLDERE